MVDPARRVATIQGINHVFFINVKIEGMVGVGRVVRMAGLRRLPGDDFTDVFNNGFTFGDILHGEDAFAVHAGAAGLDAAIVARGRFFTHRFSAWKGRLLGSPEKFGMVNRMGAQVRAHVCVCVRLRAREDWIVVR